VQGIESIGSPGGTLMLADAGGTSS